MKLEGSLDAFSLPDIFQLLSFTKKSGGLRLRHGAADGVVYFADGLVTGASADGVRQSLARRLIGSGAVDDDMIRAAVDQADENRGIGLVLVDSGSVDADLARQAATEQTVDSVFDLLRWPVGDFSFDVELNNPDDVGVRLATEAVVGESTQRQASWEAAAAVIPGPDTVLAMPVVLTVEPVVNSDEWALLALIDGRRRVGDLVELTGSGQFAVVSTLAALVSRGLLEICTEHDHVATVVRRQALLAPLEGSVGAEAPPGDTAGAEDGDVDAGPDQDAPEAAPDQDALDETTATEDAPTAAERLAASPSYSEVPEADTDVPEADTEVPDADGDVAQTVVAEADAEADADAPAPESRPVAAPPVSATAETAATASAGVRMTAPLLVGGHNPGAVVPPRPEPFLPTRRPDHPETAPAARLTGLPSANQTMAGNAAVAADPETAGLIERDPSVNRSLLLRLIAGVRGL